MKTYLMKIAPLLLLLLPVSAHAGNWSYSEEINAVTYGQSRLVPAMLEVCSSSFPDEAREQEKVWKKWEKANRRAIKKGQKAYAKIEKVEDPEKEVREMAKKEAEKFRKETKESQRETCDLILEVLRRES